jgi:Mg2+ and Co2+ transporter CorA
MKKWLVTLLLGSTLASTAWADLAQNKQEFNAKSQQFVSALNQSVAKMDKNLKALNASEQKIQGYLGQQPTAQEKQCLNAMLTRASGTKKLVTVMRQQLVSVQKQMPVLQKSAMAAQSAAQLNQAADKANALVQGLNATGEKNSQMAEQWTAKVEQACAGME